MQHKSAHHRAWAEIDLGAYRNNLRRARVLAQEAEVWPILKGNAYGHGAVRIARVCMEEQVPCVGVGDSSEALDLREHGFSGRILVLGTVIDAEVPLLPVHDIEVGVHSESRVRKLAADARRTGRKLGVHLKVDTGMGRLGVRPEAALRVARAIASEDTLVFRGLMTHFAAPTGCKDPFTLHQQALFLACLDELRAHGLSPETVHAANSAALWSGLEPIGDAVRVGIALYGMMPPGLEADPELRPVLSLRTQIVFLKDIPAGMPVGYGSRWTAHRATRIATLPMGYHDGLPYRLGAEGRGVVLVRGHRCPIVGALAMDYCMIDVGHVPGTAVGDIVTLIGTCGHQRLTTQDLASAIGTIPYEITCSLGSRVKRVFLDSEPSPAPEPRGTA